MFAIIIILPINDFSIFTVKKIVKKYLHIFRHRLIERVFAIAIAIALIVGGKY